MRLKRPESKRVFWRTVNQSKIAEDKIAESLSEIMQNEEEMKKLIISQRKELQKLRKEYADSSKIMEELLRMLVVSNLADFELEQIKEMSGR